MAELMMITFKESGHPVSRATSPLSRGQLKSKGGGKLSIHYCANLETIEFVFRTITSVNQLRVFYTRATELLTVHDVKVSEEDDFLSRSAPLFTPSRQLSVNFWFVLKYSAWIRECIRVSWWSESFQR